MTQDEVFEVAEKVGLGFIRLASAREIEKFEAFAALIASAEREKLRGQIETLGAMYDVVVKQRDYLMDQQRADIAAMRGRMQ